MIQSRSSILFKARVGFCSLLAAAIVWAIAGFVTARSVDATLGDVSRATNLLRNHMEADMDHDAIRSGVMAMLAARGVSAINAREEGEETLAATKEFRELVKKDQAFAEAPEVRNAALAIAGDVDEYTRTADAMVNQLLAGRPVTDAQIAGFRKRFLELETGMANISDKVEKRVIDTRTQAERASLVSMAVSGVCMLMICGALFMVWRKLRSDAIEPVIRLGVCVDRMCQGDLATAIPQSRTDDEVAMLSRAAENLRRKLQSADQERQEQEQLIVRSLGDALAKMASGDLTVRIEQELVGAFRQLREDFNCALSDLARTLSMVGEATGETLNTTREIATSVGDLSHRNEQQSISVQSIAASISGVNERVAEAVRSTGTASKAVNEVDAVVTQGGEVIRAAIEAMDRIETSSSQINNIVSVIDGISFQTNLLALNAGVEAARAGEAGKGFAVVATEVRALAQRSADAANEIKNLITLSGAEVQTGVRLVREAGQLLEAIVGRMTEIAGIMEHIAIGARDQASSLSEIDKGTKSLEQITQSNAALAEQVSAATRQVVTATEDVGRKLATLTLSRPGGFGSGFTAQRAA